MEIQGSPPTSLASSANTSSQPTSNSQTVTIWTAPVQGAPVVHNVKSILQKSDTVTISMPIIIKGRNKNIVCLPGDGPKAVGDISATYGIMQTFGKSKTSSTIEARRHFIKEKQEEMLTIDEDIIEGILPPRGLLLIDNKLTEEASTFIIQLVIQLLNNQPFLDMKAPRPIRSFYSNITDKYHLHIQGRISKKVTGIDPNIIRGHPNLCTSGRKRFKLSNSSLTPLSSGILTEYPRNNPIDLIVVTSIPNSKALDSEPPPLSRILQYLDKLRNIINPDAGIILSHQDAINPPSSLSQKFMQEAFSQVHKIALNRHEYNASQLIYENSAVLDHKQQIALQVVNKQDSLWCLQT